MKPLQTAFQVVQWTKEIRARMRQASIRLATVAVAATGILLTGCNTSHVTITRPDGWTVEIRNCRFAWATGSYVASWTTNGATMSAQNSTADTAALEAIAAGAVRGAITSKP